MSLGHQLGGRDPFIDAILICFNLGLLWMLTLVGILVRREQGSLDWSHVRDALWLRAPGIRRAVGWADGSGGGPWCSPSGPLW